MTTDEFIGDRVHQVMWRSKLRQTQVAPLLGMSQSGLGRKIRGERSWSLDELIMIAGILNVHATDLLPPEMAEQLLRAAQPAVAAAGAATTGSPTRR